jgi:hypothetical protein
MVAAQWQRYVPPALGAATLGCSSTKAAKVRFLAEMYSRACYSMMVVSSRSPLFLRIPFRCACRLPISRAVALAAGSWMVSFLDRLLPRRVHRQLALMATMMALIDQLVDDAMANDPNDASQIALFLTTVTQPRDPLQGALQKLARCVRENEDSWQAKYWNAVLLPATGNYCREEALAATKADDPSGMGFRWAGIEAAINGMWYAVGPYLGLDDNFEVMRRKDWNAEQQWMADTSLLMQMIDDWIDQEEDRAVRTTAVLSGEWSPAGVQELYRKTVADLILLLSKNGVRNNTIGALFVDLYTDFICVGLDAMKGGIAL